MNEYGNNIPSIKEIRDSLKLFVVCDFIAPVTACLIFIAGMIDLRLRKHILKLRL